MPIATVLTALQQILDGTIIPGTAGTLRAFITPLDPRDDADPAIYIWTSRGREKRQSVPRASVVPSLPSASGFKEQRHSCDAYITWFDDDEDPNIDLAFISIVDQAMQTLRSCSPRLAANDPQTGFPSSLVNIGEDMDYTIGPQRATSDQRMLRYDALITIQVLEEFQA